MHSIFFRYWGDALRSFRVRHPTREMPPPLARNSEKESVQYYCNQFHQLVEMKLRGGRDNSRRCAMRGRRRDGDDGPG